MTMPAPRITDALCCEAICWMREHDYDPNKDAEYVALRFDRSPHEARIMIDRGREIELRKKLRGVTMEDVE